MVNKNKKTYEIKNTSECVATEEKSLSIENNIYYSNYRVELQENEVIIDERKSCTDLNNGEGSHSEFDIDRSRDYGDSTTNFEILEYFKKNNIEYIEDDCLNYEIRNRNAYGIEYKDYFETLAYMCELSESEAEEIENMGWEVVEQ